MVSGHSVSEVEPSRYPGLPQEIAPPGPGLQSLLDHVLPLLGGRTVWHVNATATGGGVAELLFGYLRRHNRDGVHTRWLVAHADPEFFAITKNLFFRLYSHPRRGEPLTAEHANTYSSVTQAHAEETLKHVAPGDLVVLHDPATLGLALHLRRAGVLPIWQCHLGSISTSDRQDEAWDFLEPYLAGPAEFIFSHPAYPPPRLPQPAHIILPAIDEYSPKNRPLDASTVSAILATIGLTAPTGAHDTVSGRPDGWASTLAHVIQRDALPPEAPVVVQISRWDETKDMTGVLRSFLEIIAVRNPAAHLVLAGPDPAAIADDPGGVEVLGDIVEHLKELSDERGTRVHLVTTSGADLEGTAFIINAIQTAATVITQKSLCEGFGLTVAEGKWKAKPVVASRVGAVPSQVKDGIDGVLVDNPADLEQFGSAVCNLLGDPGRAGAMAAAARSRVGREFLLTRQLAEYLDCYRSALGAGEVG